MTSRGPARQATAPAWRHNQVDETGVQRCCDDALVESSGSESPSRHILDDPETYGRHFSRRPGAEDEIRRLSAKIESTLASDKAEIERRQKELEASKAKERDIDMGLEL